MCGELTLRAVSGWNPLRADLATGQRILGHASPVTTSAYDRWPEETQRKALHVPYLRRE